MATYFEGKTIDIDQEAAVIKIEGEKHVIEGGSKMTLPELEQKGEEIIKNHATRNALLEARTAHVSKLRQGRDEWNKWRTENPQVRPVLYELNQKDGDAVPLHCMDKANFSNANLIEANLAGANLKAANFHEANLGGANLTGADLTGANFCRADFYQTVLLGANLTDASLQGAQIAGTKFGIAGNEKTKIKNCKVYGSSAWDINLKDTEQKELEIIYNEGGKEFKLNVDDLRMAQFLYFILHNENLTNVFGSTSSAVVLILGRFAKGGLKVLEKVKKELRALPGKSFVPIIFDFEKPAGRNYTEVITVLAGISKFIIADLTNASSIPQELHAIVGTFGIPLIPIIKNSGKKSNRQVPYSMFEDNYKYYWVHPVINYPHATDLTRNFNDFIKHIEKFCEEVKCKRGLEKKWMAIDKLNEA